MVMRFLKLLTTLVLLTAACNAERTVPCGYYEWTDERGFFAYCEATDFSLAAKFKNEIHRFKDSAEKQGTTAIKLVRAGKVDFLPEEMITTFPKFDGFILEGSEIPLLKAGLFTPKFSGVKFLEIQHNNLKEVEENAFVNTPNIEWIRLASNQLDHLNTNIFKNNKKLKYIDFRNNLIKSITPKLCNGCRYLEQVLFTVRNICIEKDFKKSEDTLKTIAKELIVCFETCQNSGRCDKGGPLITNAADFNKETCGQQKVGVSFINKGKEFPRGKWPWMAALYYKNEYICGGSLISKKHVLTAAHCIIDKGGYQEKKPEDSFVYLGKYNLDETEIGELKVLITKFTVNPDWDATQGTKYIGDLAVILLKDTITYTDYIRPICLNAASTPIEDLLSIGNNEGVVTGWGTRENSVGKSDKAREVEVPIVHHLQCLRSDVSFYWIFSDESSFCGGKRDGSGPCRGDSGGGIYIRRANKWTLVGITSASLYAENKCDLNNYVIFTDVGKHDQWILENIF